MPPNEYMGPASMPNMTLPQHFHVQPAGSHQHPPGGHPHGPPVPEQSNVPYSHQGYVLIYTWYKIFENSTYNIFIQR